MMKYGFKIIWKHIYDYRISYKSLFNVYWNLREMCVRRTSGLTKQLVIESVKSVDLVALALAIVSIYKEPYYYFSWL